MNFMKNDFLNKFSFIKEQYVSTAVLVIWLLVRIVQIFCTNSKETIISELIFTNEYFIFKLACSTVKKLLK